MNGVKIIDPATKLRNEIVNAVDDAWFFDNPRTVRGVRFERIGDKLHVTHDFGGAGGMQFQYANPLDASAAVQKYFDDL